MVWLASTTIRLEVPTKKALASLKNYEKESFDDVVERLINMAKEEPPLDEEEIRQIEKGLEDIRKGRVKTWAEAKKEWGG